MTDQERLAAYDRMYADLLAERDKVAADMDKLRSAGRNRGATYQQLLAQKLTVQNLIGRFEIYGIKETASKRNEQQAGAFSACLFSVRQLKRSSHGRKHFGASRRV